MSKILNALNPEQAAAASTLAGPVLVLAGAGTGKTRVITFRIAYMLSLGIAPEQILGLTFTNKAAREMRERLAQLVDANIAEKVTLGTFHSFCIKILRREIRHLGYLPSFTIADESDQQGLLKQAVAELGYHQSGLNLGDVAGTIGRWKNKLLEVRDVRKTADTEYDSVCAEVYECYQSMLEMQNMLDFDDMLLLVFRLFNKYPEVLQKYQERYRYLLIDEYQDTNDAQFTLVKMLAGRECNLCVVGDDDQSIYSWRGANVSNILDFPQFFPGAKVVKLEQNYRSCSSILNAANAVISNNSNRHDKALWSNLGAGDPVKIVKVSDGEAEADFIGGMIRQIMGEKPELSYKDFAVLYRSNHLTRELEQSFRRQQLPYRLVGGQEFFKRKEIKDAVAYLKILVNPMEDQSLLRILGTPPRGLAQKAVDELKRLRLTRHIPMVELLGDDELVNFISGKGGAAAKELAGVIAKYTQIFTEPGNLANKISNYLRDVGYLDGLQKIYKDIDDAYKRRENVDEFISAVAQYEGRQKSEECTLENYLESFALLEENDRTEESLDGNEVTFSTVHAAKGLEYPVVFVVAMEYNIFPHERAVAEGSVEEELRLFYVAITRAKRQLYLLRANSRMQRGFSKTQLPSPFLALLPESIAETVAANELLRPADSKQIEQAFADIFKMLEKR